MTKDKQAPEEKKKPSKLKRLTVIAFIILLLIGGGAGAGLYFGLNVMGAEPKEEDHSPKLVVRTDEEHAAEGEGEKSAQRVGTVSVPNDRFKPDPKKYAVAYHPMGDSFTTNLADGSGFLQIGISLSTYYDDKVVANIKRQSVPIRSAVLMVLAEQDPAYLSTSQGKQRLQSQLTQAINEVLRSKEGFGGVDNVYFTSLVIQ
jgi:flagellar protein FliL